MNSNHNSAHPSGLDVQISWLINWERRFIDVTSRPAAPAEAAEWEEHERRLNDALSELEF